MPSSQTASMSSPPGWAVGDLEKQDSSDSGASPTDGGTTLADETTEVPEGKVFAHEEAGITTDGSKAQSKPA